MISPCDSGDAQRSASPSGERVFDGGRRGRALAGLRHQAVGPSNRRRFGLATTGSAIGPTMALLKIVTSAQGRFCVDSTMRSKNRAIFVDTVGVKSNDFNLSQETRQEPSDHGQLPAPNSPKRGTGLPGSPRAATSSVAP